ncbi:NAD(P)/FAD-dependent oxidoreductase [Amycolatopsis sp. GM8]|uniref:NAD(P)/FAD-dependent oxidoreductase n=1 Tax=Amycolatopsis sp. GM8 TaxID=2896530 RepID=UPI001F395478|nr:FAD-dependent oxidoreductase [Amycolatopsis sp. GM8]
MSAPEVLDVAVVGGGIAALTAGLFAAGFGLRTAVLTEIVLGGELINLEEVDRYPGLTEPVSGSELASRVEAQAVEAGAEFVFDDVTGISRESGGFLVAGLSDTTRAATVILATGAKRRKLGVAGEDALEGRGISYCGTCDGPFFKDRPVAVVGDDDFAGREALVVARYASDVTLITSRPDPQLASATYQAIEASERIRVLPNAEVTEVHESGGVLTAVQVRDVGSAAVTDLSLAGLFVNSGMAPNTGLLESLLDEDAGCGVVVDAGMRTPVPGLFAAGGARRGFGGYAVMAAADGATAATSARDFLRDQAE